jgi:chemotaxis protein CheX
MAVAVTLPAALDTEYAETLRSQLLALRGQPLAIDGSAVERLGGLCLQVLLSAQQTWLGDGHAMTIDPASDDFANQWNTFGAGTTALEQGVAA